MRNFYDFLFVGIKKNLTHMYMDRSALEDVIVHHRTIFEAIKHRSSQEAFEAMRSHILYVQEYFKSR